LPANLSFGQSRRDPWWDLEGAGVRRWRRVRALEAAVAWACVAAVGSMVMSGHTALTAIL
jgi:hypothetical protein